MKKIIFILILIFQFTNVFSQTSTWQWALNAGNNEDDRGNGIATDSNGNVYSTGSFASSNITFGTYTLTNNSYYSGYILKQDTLGNVIWAKCITGTSNNNVGCGDICTDSNGNIYVVGTFQGIVNFEGVTLTANGISDIFIIKYDSNGNQIFVKQSSNSYLNSVGQKIFVDNNGYIYITGVFGGALGSQLNFNNQIVTNSVQGYQDVYLFKLDSNANAIWGKSISGITTKNVKSIGADNNGNVYLIGDFLSPTITIGNTTLTNSVSNSSTADIYIARYNNSGDVVWAYSFGGQQYDYGRDLKVDSNGDIHVTGSFYKSSINFNGTILQGNNSCLNTYVLEFDNNFNIIWGRSFGYANNNSNGHSVDVDIDGNTYLAGDFYVALNIGSFNLINVGTNGWGDIYVIKYDSQGNVLQANSAGGNYIEETNKIRVNNNGDAFLTGRYYSPTLTFGSHSLTNNSIYNKSDIFISKLQFNSLSNNEQLNTDKITLYPNPMISNSFLDFEEEQINTIIQITDMIGKEIKKINFSGRRMNIEKSGLKSGIYFIIITNSQNEKEIKKLVID